MIQSQFYPMQLIQMIKSGKNPQQLVIAVLEQQMGNTPVGKNLLTLAKQGKTNDIEQIVRNLAQQQGVDFDKEFTNFRHMLGM